MMLQLWLRQGQVEILDATPDEQRLSVEVTKRAGSTEDLHEITVRHDESISDNDRLTLTVTVVCGSAVKGDCCTS